MAFKKPVKLTKISSSALGCILPRSWLEKHYSDDQGLIFENGNLIELEIDDNQIVIRPLPPKARTKVSA